jgi:hypothetical protein
MNNPKLKITAPWTQEQVDCLNAYQKCGLVHSYTCNECGQDLFATKDGWVCPSYYSLVQQQGLKVYIMQDWALYFATIFNEEEYLKANKDIGKFVQRCNFMADDFLTKTD